MKYFHASKIQSYNGIFNFINTNRNYGKTWGFKKRAVKRALKHGKKTVWVRRFKKEVKECVKKMFSSRDLQEFCGVSFYDKKTNPYGNLKMFGNTFYIKRGKKWVDFLQVVAVSESNSMRSADDIDIDTIIFDEYTTTIDKYKRYKGNEVTDFIDLFHSIKRNHIVRCFFLGNKESIYNPYLQYFKIKPLPHTWEGIKSYRNGSLVLQQINNITEIRNDFQTGCYDLFLGTNYGDYIYESKYKATKSFKRAKCPQNALEYVQIYFNNTPFRIKTKDGLFYVSSNVDTSQLIYSDNLTGKYKKERQLLRRFKPLFYAFLNAISDNLVYYTDESIYESIQPFLKWLGTI